MGLQIYEQSFIAGMMASKALPQQKTIDLYNSCLATFKKGIKIRDVDSFQRRIDGINKNLSSVDLEFKTIYSPWENEQFWGICNTVEDEDVEGAVIFKGIGEKKMFFDIIDDLVEDLTAGGEGMIPFNDAQNVASTHGLNISDGGQFLQRLNQYKWLKTIRSGTGDAYVAPGSRSLLELPQLRALAVKRNISGSNAQSRNLAVQSSAKTEDEYDRNAAPSPRKRTRDRKDNGSDLDAGSQSQRSTQKRSEKPSRFRG